MKLSNGYEVRSSKGALENKTKRAKSGSQRRKDRGMRSVRMRGRRGGLATYQR